MSKLPEYQYHLKDHLGKVRLTFSASPDTEVETATLEIAHEEEENANFLRYAETTKINSTLFDHTGNGDTHYAIRLNGSENERRGLAKSLAVMTGDMVRAEVYAKYLDPDQNNWTAALQNLMAAMAGGTAPTGTVIEAVPPSGGDGFPFEGLLDGMKANDTGLQAYLNILVFDENLIFVDGAFVPVTTAAMENGTDVPHEKLSQEIVVQQPGFVYIYLSNDNGQPLEVFFDDFTVEHVHSAIIQADDYYPFGLTFNGYRRENGVANKYKYNGKEEQQETGWYDFGARMYDPQRGQFLTIDPLADADKNIGMSPYTAMANNPVTYIDPDGRCWQKVGEEYVPCDNADIGATTTGAFGNSWTMTESNGWQLTNGADPSTVDAYYTEQTPDGSAAYYENRYKEHIEKYNTRPPDYYLGYGHKYNVRFNSETRASLSEAGKEWLDQTTVELQVLMEGALRDNPNIELNNGTFQKFAFESHVPAYTKGNLLYKLGDGDKIKIGLTPDFRDLFSPLGIKQAWQIMDMMGKYNAAGKYNKARGARPFEF